MNYHLRKILVPTDLSDASLNAVDTAVALAARNEAALVLLFVAERVWTCTNASRENLMLPNEHVKDVLHALAGRASDKLDGRVRLEQQAGCVMEHILQLSAEEGADLIVMGSHGNSGYRRDFIGSNTYAVIKHAHCPVLSIPPGKKYFSFSKTVFPVRPVAGALARSAVVRSFLAPGAVVDVLGLANRPMEGDTKILDRIVQEAGPGLEGAGMKVRTVWAGGNLLADEVLTYAQQNLSDLIVTTPPLDIIDKPGFVGPQTQKIVNGAKVPVLSLKSLSVPAGTEKLNYIYTS